MDAKGLCGDWQDGRFLNKRPSSSSQIDASLVTRSLVALQEGSRGVGARAAASRELDACGFLEKYAWPFWAGANVESDDLILCIIHVRCGGGLMRGQNSLRAPRRFGAFGAYTYPPPVPPPQLINERAREASSPPFAFARADEIHFLSFFNAAALYQQQPSTNLAAKAAFVELVTHAAGALDEAGPRKAVMRLVSLNLWRHVAPARVELELVSRGPALRRAWVKVCAAATAEAEANKVGAGTGGTGTQQNLTLTAAAFCGATSKARTTATMVTAPLLAVIPQLLGVFLALLEADTDMTSSISHIDADRFCEFILFLVKTFLNALPTRRFFLLLINDSHLLLRARGSALARDAARGALFRPLLFLAEAAVAAPIDEQTGESRPEAAGDEEWFARVGVLQRLCHKHLARAHRTARELALGAVGALADPAVLHAALEPLPDASLIGLARRLRLLPVPEDDLSAAADAAGAGAKRAREGGDAGGGAEASGSGGTPPPLLPPLPPTRANALAVLEAHHARPTSALASANALPLLPTEKLLWSPNALPRPRGSDRGAPLALPSLGLQYLSLYDFLLRNFELMRLEAAFPGPRTLLYFRLLG